MRKSVIKILRKKAFNDYMIWKKRGNRSTFQNFFRHIKRLYLKGEIAI